MTSPTMEACAAMYERDTTTPPLYPRDHCSGIHHCAPFRHVGVQQNMSLQSPTRTPSPQPQQSPPTLSESSLWDPISPILLESPLSDSSDMAFDFHLTTYPPSQLSPQPPTPPPSPQTPLPSPLKMSPQWLLSSPQSPLPPPLRAPIPKPHTLRHFLVDSSPLVPHLPRLSPQSPSPQSSRTHLPIPTTLKMPTSKSQTPRHFLKDSSPVASNSFSSYHSQKSPQSPPPTPPSSPQTPHQSPVKFLPPKPQSPWKFLQGLSPVLQNTTPAQSQPSTRQPLITQSPLPPLHTPTPTSQVPPHFLHVSFTQFQQNTHSSFLPPQQSRNQNNNSQPPTNERDIGRAQYMPTSRSPPIYVKSQRFSDDLYETPQHDKSQRFSDDSYEIPQHDCHQGNPLPPQPQRWSQSSNIFIRYSPFALLSRIPLLFRNQRPLSSSASDHKSRGPHKPILTTHRPPGWRWRSVTFKDPLSYTVAYKGVRKKVHHEEEPEEPAPPSNKGVTVCTTIVFHYISCLGFIMLTLYNERFYQAVNESMWQGIAVGTMITLVTTLFIYTFLYPMRYLAMAGTITLNVLMTIVTVYAVYGVEGMDYGQKVHTTETDSRKT